MTKLFKKFAGGIHILEHGGCWLSAFSVFFMAIITTVDVIGRYFLHHSLAGTQEIVQLSMNVFVYSGLTYAIYKKDYVTVPVVLDKLKPRARLIVETIVTFLMFAAGCVLCYSLWVSAVKWMSKWAVVTTTLGIPQTPFYILTAVCVTIISIELLFQTVTGIIRVAQYQPLPAGEALEADAKEENAHE